MSKTTNITIPDLGEFADVEVIEVLVSAGDQLDVEDGVITLETDKATMDVPTPIGGKLVSVSVAVGDTVNSGDVIAVIEAAASDTQGEAAEEAAEEAADDARFTETEVLDTGDGDTVIRKVAAGALGAQAVVIPELGDFSDVEVIDVLVAPGEQVEVEQSLVTLETDKATMDVPSSVAGEILEVLVSVGDRVNPGDKLATVMGGAESAPANGASAGVAKDAAPDPAAKPPADAPTVPAKPTEPPADTPAPTAAAASGTGRALPAIDESGFSRAHASPSVRQLAREMGVDLVSVKGSGRKGRITADDVKAWVKTALAGGSGAGHGGGALPATPRVDFAQFGPVHDAKLSRIQKISGPRLQASWINIPHVTQHDLADITELEQRRQQLKGPAKENGISLTPLAFVVRAVVSALAEFPLFASSLNANGDGLVMKDYCHIGFAADTPNGLVVPVIRDANRLDIYEIATALGDLSRAARDGKLKLDQMQGAVFTISSLGGIGGTAFTPIVNAPEVAILGVSRSSMQPTWDGEAFQPRLMLPLSLSYDHRVIDGAAAVRFTTRLGELLGQVGGLLEAQP